jgi:glycosyltransferase involved in cell wall biosynthesis
MVVYGSDFSIAGYTDREFGTAFAWDTDLLTGYDSQFLTRVADGGPGTADRVSADGLDRVLDKMSPATILACGYTSTFDRAVIRSTLRRSIPLLIRAETTDHAKRRSRLKSMMRDWMLRRLYNRCAGLLSIGTRSREHYIRLGVPDSKLFESRYCIDPAPFRTTEEDRIFLRNRMRTEMEIVSNRILILFSGKIVTRKGVDLLLPAIRQLPHEIRSRIVLTFLGDGELRERLVAEAATDPSVEVRFLGFRNQTKLSECYHAADMLVLPSRECETWGLVVNDALHHGVPVIASDAVGCVPDLITPGSTGEVFASGNASDLSLAFTRAFSLIGRREIREACRKRISAFSVERSAMGILAAFRSIAVEAVWE